MAVLNPYQEKQPSIKSLVGKWELAGLIRSVFWKEYSNYWRDSTGIAILLQKTVQPEAWRLVFFTA